jgi:ADP-heptose:LPS heptosyltransferase
LSWKAIKLISRKLAKTSEDLAGPLLVVELWGLGDLALAMPFLRAASRSRKVTLLAKEHAAPLLERFAPDVEHVTLAAPWTAFRGKYVLHRWPWARLAGAVGALRSRKFTAGVSARSDPRDHALLALSGARNRLGFARQGSGVLLSRSLAPPTDPHRAARWTALAACLGTEIEAPIPATRTGNRVLIHAGAGQPVRLWPRDRYEQLAATLARDGWAPEIIDDTYTGVAELLSKLDSADRFIGNDSGPGHLAALLGVPTFTVFGPQLPELFAPRSTRAAWIEGGPCPFKPCWDSCRYPEPHCILSIGTEAVATRVAAWIKA